MKKLAVLIPLSLTAFLLFAGLASAHVVVYPATATQGSYEKFTVRVPTEKEVPTVKVEVAIPAEVNVSRFEPMPGWTFSLTKDATGKITSVVWTATGEGLSPTEFGEFNMQGKVGDQAAQIVWKAIQTYKDGSTAEWTGGPDAKTPASVTKVNPKPAGASGDDHNHNGAEASASGSGENSSRTPLILSIVAVAFSAASLVLAARRKPSRS